MSLQPRKEKDFQSIGSSGRKPGRPVRDLAPLRPTRAIEQISEFGSSESEDLRRKNQQNNTASIADEPQKPEVATPDSKSLAEPGSRAERKEKKTARDRELLTRDRWLIRKGHSLSFFGLYLFSIMVLFRPYETVPGLGFLSATAFYLAIATIAIYIPSQIASEGNLTMLSTEVKAVLALTAIAIITIPLARDPGLAWKTFNDPFIKAVAIFIVMVNVVRTRERLMSMMWLSLGIGLYLSYFALDQYRRGIFIIEEYRVAVDVGGMFGNPNEMAMHLVMMTPIAIALGIAASGFRRLMYWAIAALFIAANMVTFSRGGFIGLITCLGVLAWKIGRRHRMNVAIASIVVGGIATVAAPGNYGLRMLSIFIPGLDTVGSSDQRRELLERSLLVTARNPWGIGIGNFPLVGQRNLQTHNAFTQVSAELGILGLIAYLVFMISPFRKLRAIERTLFEKDEISWHYYLAIGLQASIIGYMASSFFASVAYGWFIYYLIAYSVAFRRIYAVETGIKEEDVQPQPILRRAEA